ncbi:hypothetical protein [uncultured Bacteroides sp.]|uniref:hypothetical protein n=1 Tax=Bacteroides sp. f07 TaxID=3132704 RepID=UPI00280C091E|nr:hypothetical protein [uncultured Bacteroides sp.]
MAIYYLHHQYKRRTQCVQIVAVLYWDGDLYVELTCIVRYVPLKTFGMSYFCSED